MNANKITQVHVYLIGGVLMMLIAVGLWYLLLKPLNEENAILQQSIQGTETATVSVAGGSFTIDRIKEAEKQLEKAKVTRDSKERQLNGLLARKSLPRSEAIDLGKTAAPPEVLVNGTMARWLNLPRVVVNKMESFAQQSARKHGVTIETNFQAPAPTTDPTSLPRRVFAWNLGTMSVTGEFNRVMKWAQEWNNAPLLSSVDGLKLALAGPGGRVQATSALTVFIFPTGEATKSAAPAAPAATGGVPGMPGMPGMPGSPGGAGSNVPGNNMPGM
jgi:hypothetical protein